MLHPNDNPPIRPPRVNAVEHLEGPWWVAHTKARNEKAFAWQLTRLGIDHFLPMIERIRISGGKKRRVFQPLFPSYVFFCGDEEARYRAMTTNRLCQVIEAPEPDRFAEELAAIDRAVRGEAELELHAGLPVGTPARIVAGPFEGMEGVVVEWSQTARLVLQVRMLGQGAALEIEPDLVEPMTPGVEIHVGGLDGTDSVEPPAPAARPAASHPHPNAGNEARL